MNLLWPKSLLILGLVPILALIYVREQRRRRYALRYSSLALVRDAVPRSSAWRRHIPFGLFLLALGSLVIALARPYTQGLRPSDQAVIILALDVSRSMCSTDILPNRLQAAENAALDFIHQQKPTTQIGVIAFSSFAEQIQSPTTDPERLQSAIQSLELGSTTAIGSGILRSLDAIAEADPNISPSQPVQPGDPALDATPDLSQTLTGTVFGLTPQPDIIILLTDGINNTGPAPLVAARQAAERGVRVYIIGYGTPDGSMYPDCPSNLVSSDPTPGFMLKEIGSYHHPHGTGGVLLDQMQVYSPVDGNGTGGGGVYYPRGIDEAALKQVAALTGGTYSAADSAGQLQQVFDGLSVARVLHPALDEISVAFTALGAVLAALAIGLSMYWRPV